MHPESPRTLILTGPLDTREIKNLVYYCIRLHASGQCAVNLDMVAVTSCDRAGLEGLTALTGGASGLTVTVEGARWGQFMTTLSLADVRELQSLCDQVRALLRPTV